jgi:hypothetical protein
MLIVAVGVVAVVRHGSSPVLARRGHYVIAMKVEEACKSFVGTRAVDEMKVQSASIFGGKAGEGN